MTAQELNIVSKIKVRSVEEQRDYLLEQNMLLTGKIATLEKENAELKEKYDKVDIIGYDALKNLTKAENIIRELLFHLTNDTFYVTFETREQSVERARQFLQRRRKMKDEEMAEEYYFDVADKDGYVHNFQDIKQAFLAGLKAGRPQWHKVADGDLPKGDDGFSKNGIHRNIYLKDRYGNLYTGNYFPKDETHKEDGFAVEFLDWGFQGSQFCAKEQISEWCEIPTFDKE